MTKIEMVRKSEIMQRPSFVLSAQEYVIQIVAIDWSLSYAEHKDNREWPDRAAIRFSTSL